MTTKTLLDSPERLLDILDRQGSWTEEEYLSLTDHTTRLVEFTGGFLELLPTPTDDHQALVQFLLYAFDSFLKPLGGKVRIAPLRLRIAKGRFREPDLLLLSLYSKDSKSPWIRFLMQTNQAGRGSERED